MLRRDFVSSLVALASAPGFAAASTPDSGKDDSVRKDTRLRTGDPVPFSEDWLREHAQALAEADYQDRATIPEEWTKLTFDEFRHLHFDPMNALWTGHHEVPLRLDVFPTGLYYDRAVDIYVVENGQAAPLMFDLDVFRKTDQFPDLPIDETLGYSGLRLRSELKDPGFYTEFAVFHGASYFRAIATDQIYGLSARGLAIDTAEPTGEEFPDFTAMWLEKPAPDAKRFVLHALMDSPSVTGAFRFEIEPGSPLRMDVSATLFPRVELDHVGLGALTSMFQYDETNRDRFPISVPPCMIPTGCLWSTVREKRCGGPWPIRASCRSARSATQGQKALA